MFREDRYKYCDKIFKVFCKDLNADGVKRDVIKKEDAQKIISRYANFFNKIFFDCEPYWINRKCETLGDFFKKVENNGLECIYGWCSRSRTDDYNGFILYLHDKDNPDGSFKNMFLDVHRDGAFCIHLFEEGQDIKIAYSVFFEDHQFYVLAGYDFYHQRLMEKFEEQKYQDRYISAMTDLFGEDYKKHYEEVKFTDEELEERKKLSNWQKKSEEYIHSL